MILDRSASQGVIGEYRACATDAFPWSTGGILHLSYDPISIRRLNGPIRRPDSVDNQGTVQIGSPRPKNPRAIEPRMPPQDGQGTRDKHPFGSVCHMLDFAPLRPSDALTRPLR